MAQYELMLNEATNQRPNTGLRISQGPLSSRPIVKGYSGYIMMTLQLRASVTTKPVVWFEVPSLHTREWDKTGSAKLRAA